MSTPVVRRPQGIIENDQAGVLTCYQLQPTCYQNYIPSTNIYSPGCTHVGIVSAFSLALSAIPRYGDGSNVFLISNSFKY